MIELETKEGIGTTRECSLYSKGQDIWLERGQFQSIEKNYAWLISVIEWKEHACPFDSSAWL